MALSRASSIAITETHNAFLFANFQSTNVLNGDFNLGLKKEWMSVEDSAVRESHMFADGQVVNMDGMFNVAGVQMLHPGDTNAPPEEIIRCRCVLGFNDVL